MDENGKGSDSQEVRILPNYHSDHFFPVYVYTCIVRFAVKRRLVR